MVPRHVEELCGVGSLEQSTLAVGAAAASSGVILSYPSLPFCKAARLETATHMGIFKYFWYLINHHT
jgi:hypothetical protein